MPVFCHSMKACLKIFFYFWFCGEFNVRYFSCFSFMNRCDLSMSLSLSLAEPCVDWADQGVWGVWAVMAVSGGCEYTSAKHTLHPSSPFPSLFSSTSIFLLSPRLKLFEESLHECMRTCGLRVSADLVFRGTTPERFGKPRRHWCTGSVTSRTGSCLWWSGTLNVAIRSWQWPLKRTAQERLVKLP